MPKKLMLAIKRKDLVVIKKIAVEHRQALKEIDGLKAMSEAVKTNDIEVVKLLLKLGAEINDEDGVMYDNETPLAVACSSGSLEIVEALLEAGAVVDTSREDCEFLNPLMCAVVGGYFDIVRLLVERGANIDIVRDGGSSALSIAIECRYEDIVKYLTSLTSCGIISES
jgi:uncharacterized protein